MKRRRIREAIVERRPLPPEELAKTVVKIKEAVARRNVEADKLTASFERLEAVLRELDLPPFFATVDLEEESLRVAWEFHQQEDRFRFWVHLYAGPKVVAMCLTNARLEIREGVARHLHDIVRNAIKAALRRAVDTHTAIEHIDTLVLDIEKDRL